MARTKFVCNCIGNDGRVGLQGLPGLMARLSERSAVLGGQLGVWMRGGLRGIGMVNSSDWSVEWDVPCRMGIEAFTRVYQSCGCGSLLEGCFEGSASSRAMYSGVEVVQCTLRLYS